MSYLLGLSIGINRSLFLRLKGFSELTWGSGQKIHLLICLVFFFFFTSGFLLLGVYLFILRRQINKIIELLDL